MIEIDKHVRRLNSMYRDYGVGKVCKVRDGLCKVAFGRSRLWRGTTARRRETG
jgi:hypothetical protein